MTALRLATRGSDLALAQAHIAARVVAEVSGFEVEIESVSTRGDRSAATGHSLSELAAATPGLFVTEVEQRVLERAVDMAVHSYKDLPRESPGDATIAAVLPRAAAADVLLIHPHWHTPERPLQLRDGCRVGTGSPRRAALLGRFAPQASAQPLRGSVVTRLKRCADEVVGAVILAAAGLARIETLLAPVARRLVRVELDPGWWQPAPAQGALVIQSRRDSPYLHILRACDDAATRSAVAIERACQAALGGGCGSVLGAYAARAPSDRSGRNWVLQLGYAQDDNWLATRSSGSLGELEAAVAVWAAGGSPPGEPVP